MPISINAAATVTSFPPWCNNLLHVKQRMVWQKSTSNSTTKMQKAKLNNLISVLNECAK